SCPACLRHPISTSVCGSKDGTAFAHGRSVVCICEGNSPQILGCTADLNRPAASAIYRPDNRPILANDCASVRIHKGSATKVISLWKRILPAPLRISSVSWEFVRGGRCCVNSRLSGVDSQ